MRDLKITARQYLHETTTVFKLSNSKRLIIFYNLKSVIIYGAIIPVRSWPLVVNNDTAAGSW